MTGQSWTSCALFWFIDENDHRNTCGTFRETSSADWTLCCLVKAVLVYGGRRCEATTFTSRGNKSNSCSCFIYNNKPVHHSLTPQIISVSAGPHWWKSQARHLYWTHGSCSGSQFIHCRVKNEMGSVFNPLTPTPNQNRLIVTDCWSTWWL